MHVFDKFENSWLCTMQIVEKLGVLLKTIFMTG